MRGFHFSIRSMNLSLFTFANGGKSPTLLEKDKKIPGILFFRQKFTFDDSPYSPSITLAFPRWSISEFLTFQNFPVYLHA